MRTFFRVLGLLVMVFTGGCSLFFLASFIKDGVYDLFGFWFVMGVLPFFIGLAIFGFARPKD